MLKISKATLLFALLALSISANARTWTSKDGRTIEATLVEKGEDFVVLRLDATGRTVTVKHALLSADDVEYAKKVEPARVSTDNIDIIISKFPALDYKDENGKQLNEKYSGFVRIMTPETARAVAEMIRKKLPDDVKYWKEQSERKVPPIKQPIITDPNATEIRRERNRERQEKIDAVKANYIWLSKTLPAWLAKVEKAAP